MTGMLQKIRTLAVQASNGTNTAEDRKALDTEATALVAEIDRIASQTKFGGKTILDGADKGANSIYMNDNKSIGQLVLQVGANKGDTISFDVSNMKFSMAMEWAGLKTGKVGNDAFWDKDKKLLLSTASGAAATIAAMDKIIGAVDAQRAGLGAIQNRLESSIRNQANVSANQADARSRIRDADFAEESANLSQQSIIQQAATSMLMQANTRPQLGLSLLG